jgi:hypothetical protein
MIPSKPQFNGRLGGSQGWSGRFGKTKNIIIITIIIGLSPGGSGYLTRIQNMKLVSY